MTAINDSQLHGLLEALYEAATRPDGWGDALTLFREVTSNDTAALQVYEPHAARGRLLWWSGVPNEGAAEYEHWIAKNPSVRACAVHMSTGGVIANTPVTRAELERTEFFNEFLLRHQIPIHPASAVCIYREESVAALFSCDRFVGRPDFDRQHERLLRCLLPHLQRAISIYRRLADADLERAAGVQTLERLEFGVALLSGEGKALFLNTAARAILDERDGLFFSGGFITAEPPLHDRLNALVVSACRYQGGAPASGGAMTVPRTNQELPLELVVAPLRLRQFSLASVPPVAAAFIHDPKRSTVTVARLQQLYGLTPAEARVAQGLRSGLTVKETAETSRTSVATVRTHVHRLLAKLRARGLSDLTRRLAALPRIK